jgi:capsid protein
MNFARDFLDNTQYRLIRAKIEAMIGMVIKRDHNLAGMGFQYDASGSPITGTDGQGTNAVKPYLQYELKSGMKLELEREDSAEFLEAKTPSAEWMAFGKELCRLILAARNIPLSMFDPSNCNYATMKADRELYRLSSHEERGKNADSYRHFADHVLNNAYGTGQIELPPGINDPEDIPYNLVPKGSFLLDPEKESASIQSMVAAGHLTNEDASHRLGTGDFYENAKRLAREQKFLRDNKVMVVLGSPGSAIVNPENTDASPGGGGDNNQ